jgi:adenylate cyclase
VGKYKKEIAYHGDTINTAARIQGKCNEFRKDLLISGALVKHLDQSAFSFEKLGSIELRGKGDLVDIFAAFDGN